MTKLPSWDEARFTVPSNQELFEKLTASMHEHSKSQDFGPWTRLPSEIVNGAIEEMLDPWCGIVGQVPLSDPAKIAHNSGNENLVSLYDSYVRSIDHLSLLNGISFEDLGARGWRLLDIGSLIDFLHLSAFMKFDKKRTRVLEVGGGFGRLTEFLTLITGANLQYVNIDAAPVSLMYCYEYLRARFPEKRTVMFSPDEPLGDYDFLVVPSWHADLLPKEPFDLAINIESMQEMNQELVDYYISYFDQRLTEESLVYLVNSREHLFKGEWKFPTTWETLYRHGTVRSWTVDHPTEVFRKTAADVSAINRLRKVAFEREVSFTRDGENLRKLQHEINMGRLISPPSPEAA